MPKFTQLVKVNNCKYYGCWFYNLSLQVTTYYEIVPKGVITKPASFLIDSGQGPNVSPEEWKMAATGTGALPFSQAAG